MNRIHQKHKTFKPIVADFSIVSTSFTSDSFQNKNIEAFMGVYDDYEINYYPPSRKSVALIRDVISTEDKTYDFKGSNDAQIGSKIKIEDEEFTVVDKIYDINGDTDYFIQDKFIKCENYDELYKIAEEEAKQLLEQKWEIQNQTDREKVKSEEKKKSIWWYFGIR